MKHPVELVETINKILDTAESIPGGTKAKSLINFDALNAIRHVLGRDSSWNQIGDSTVFKRKLTKNGITI
jgi:hypothetical protein